MRNGVLRALSDTPADSVTLMSALGQGLPSERCADVVGKAVKSGRDTPATPALH
jgi:hypothetical protein